MTEFNLEVKRYHHKDVFMPVKPDDPVVPGTGGYTEGQLKVAQNLERDRLVLIIEEGFSGTEALETVIDRYHSLLLNEAKPNTIGGRQA